MENLTLFWHRRDLRISDNAGLFKALKQGEKVQPIFIFDSQILSKLPKDDQRLLFIYQTIEALREAYTKLGASLWVFHGNPVQLVPELVQKRDYGWSRTRKGGWSVSQSPMLITTTTLERLQQRGNRSTLNYYFKVCPQLMYRCIRGL